MLFPPLQQAVRVAGWDIAVIVDQTMKMLYVEDSLGALSRSPLPAGVPIPHLLRVLALTARSCSFSRELSLAKQEPLFYPILQQTVTE